MSDLTKQVMEALKEAMKTKNTDRLNALRAIKSGLIEIDKSGGANSGEAAEIQMLQKLVKQRKDSAAVYKAQGREDLEQTELLQAQVIAEFLPAQLSEQALEQEIDKAILAYGNADKSSFGPLMQQLSKALSGKVEGKKLAEVLRNRLN